MNKWKLTNLILAVAFPLVCNAQHHLMTEKANQLYHNESYSESAKLYQQLINDGYFHPDLLYNAGNAYYRNKQIGMSILCYRQSLDNKWQLKTYDNLKFVQKAIKDKAYVESLEKEENKWWARFQTINLNHWSLMSLISFGILLIWFGFRYHNRFRSIIWGILPILVYGISTFFMCYTYYQRYIHYPMIVVKPIIPFSSEKKSGRKFLYEGTEFHVIDKKTNSLLIELPDGEQGYIEITDAIRW